MISEVKITNTGQFSPSEMMEQAEKYALAKAQKTNKHDHWFSDERKQNKTHHVHYELF